MLFLSHKGTAQRVAQSQLEAQSFSSCPPPDLPGLSKWNGTPNELSTTLERGLSIYPTGWWSYYSRYRREREPSSPTLLAVSPRHADNVRLPTATFSARSDLVPFAMALFAHRLTANWVPMDYPPTAVANPRICFPRTCGI